MKTKQIEEFQKIENAFNQAIISNDAQKIEKCISSDWVLVDANGGIIPRERFLHVMVYEPLWTLVPSNKAILPVLWMLYPNHPYLLDTQFELTDGLAGRGYVAKPIVGRCGANISIYDRNSELVTETAGKFGERDQIYQELFRLPKIGGYNVQLCSFSVDGTFGGACLRVDSSAIITSGSDVLPLRVVPDAELEIASLAS